MFQRFESSHDVQQFLGDGSLSVVVEGKLQFVESLLDVFLGGLHVGCEHSVCGVCREAAARGHRGGVRADGSVGGGRHHQ